MTTVGAEVAASPQDIAAIEHALRAFAKALRAVQLYLPNSPTRGAAIEHARAAFGAVWHVTDPLEIQIHEVSLAWENHPVYLEADRGTDGLPWLLYRDGLRTLIFRRDFEATDLETLLSILHKVRTAPPDHDDLVTLLWLADLATLAYRHVEHGGGVEGPVDRGADREGMAAMASGTEPLALPAVDSDLFGSGPPPGILRTDDFDTTLYFLDARETAYLQEELKREYAEDHRRLVLSSLFDIIEGQAIVEAQLEALQTVDQLMVEFLSVGEYELVAYILREASATVRRLTADELVMTALRDLPVRLSDPAVMSQLLQALDEATPPPTAPLLEELFVELRPSALEPLAAWLGSASGSPLRTVIDRAAVRLAGAYTSALADLLEHGSDPVVRGALQLVAQLATPAAVPGVARVLRTGDATLRVEAVQVLGAVASPAAMQAVERGIDDGDRDVRVATFRVIAARRHAAALPRLVDAVRRREVRTADLSEKMALFEAFGSICGDAGVGELDTLLNARGLLGAREPTEVRACAARALGLIASPSALAALQRAADTKDVVVRSAVSRAMRGSA